MIETKCTPIVETRAPKSAQMEQTLARKNARWAVSANQDTLGYMASVFHFPNVPNHRSHIVVAATRNIRLAEALARNNAIMATTSVQKIVRLAAFVKEAILEFMANVSVPRSVRPHHQAAQA